MGKTNSFPRAILRTRAPEQIEDPGMILGINTPAVILDVYEDRRSLFPAPHPYPSGPSRRKIFDRILKQIGENLLQGQPITDQVWKVFDLKGRFGVLKLVSQGTAGCFQHVLEPDRLGCKNAPSFPREPKDRIDKAVHLGGGRADEIDRLGKLDLDGILYVAIDGVRQLLRHLFVELRDGLAGDLQFAGEPHHIDQRGPQIVAYDVCEPLDLVIRRLEI